MTVKCKKAYCAYISNISNCRTNFVNTVVSTITSMGIGWSDTDGPEANTTFRGSLGTRANVLYGRTIYHTSGARLLVCVGSVSGNQSNNENVFSNNAYAKAGWGGLIFSYISADHADDPGWGTDATQSSFRPSYAMPLIGTCTAVSSSGPTYDNSDGNSSSANMTYRILGTSDGKMIGAIVSSSSYGVGVPLGFVMLGDIILPASSSDTNSLGAISYLPVYYDYACSGTSYQLSNSTAKGLFYASHASGTDNSTSSQAPTVIICQASDGTWRSGAYQKVCMGADITLIAGGNTADNPTWNNANPMLPVANGITSASLWVGVRGEFMKGYFNPEYIMACTPSILTKGYTVNDCSHVYAGAWVLFGWDESNDTLYSEVDSLDSVVLTEGA